MKLLVLTSRVPYPLEKGDKLRIFHQIKYLSKKHQIILCALNDTKLHKDAIPTLKQYCQSIYIIKLNKFQIFRNIIKAFFSKLPLQVGYFYSERIQKKIFRIIEEHKPDHIYCQLIRMAEYVKNYTVSGVPKTIDYQDAFSAGIKQRISSLPFYLKPIFKLEYKRLLSYESEVHDYFENKTIISEQDRKLINHPNKNRIHIIKNGVETGFFKPIKRAKTNDLVFIGNMHYPPNVSAAKFIVKKILPLVRKRFPKIRLILAGANPTRTVRALQSENVIVTGWVDDVREYYAISKIFIAPMHEGIGLQNKLLEAMAMKIPCITSPLANNALNAKEGVEVLVAKTPEEYANHISYLLDEPKKAKDLALNGYNFVINNYNWDVWNEKLHNILINSFLPLK